MTRRAWTWLGFGAVVALLIAAVGAVTVVALRADEAERRERARAERAAEVRLALWRMDSALQPLLAREGARPAQHYLASEGSSQLSARSSEFVLLHFDLDAAGNLHSPEVPPPGVDRHDGVDATQAAAARQHLDAVRRWARFHDLEVRLEFLEAVPVYALTAPRIDSGSDEVSQYRERAMNLATANAEAAMLASIDATVNPMQPIFSEDGLFLVRRALVGEVEHIQGVWLDWPALRKRLLHALSSELPDADLIPTHQLTSLPFPIGDHSLAALPVTLDPGRDPALEPRATTLLILLCLAWAGVLAASGAGGALLAGTLRLSDRRAAFVAAVTHELRTPLTTLTTYSEMLADERMTDEVKRKSYLATMQREAGRLGALVDNVLAYSRIERGRPGLAADELSVASLLERIAPRLRDRAAAASMELRVSELPLPAKRGEGRGGGSDLRVIADEVAVDQILFNLVDNACKHAASADDRRIDLSIASTATTVTFTVRDHGPGIPDADRRQIFAPFRRAKSTSGPGVGLGLSLCRRLARHMRGDLKLDAEPTAGGASFTLTLPSGVTSRHHSCRPTMEQPE